MVKIKPFKIEKKTIEFLNIIKNHRFFHKLLTIQEPHNTIIQVRWKNLTKLKIQAWFESLMLDVKVTEITNLKKPLFLLVVKEEERINSNQQK